MFKKWFMGCIIIGSVVIPISVYKFQMPCIWVNEAISVMWYPILKVQHAVFAPLKNIIFLQKKSAISEYIQSLENEKQELVQEVVMLRGAVQFTQDTQELVRYKQRYQKDSYILAHIILKRFEQCGHYILIDQGARHGVHKDMVAVYKNVLIGRVDTVYPLWSKIVLVSDPACKIAAFCAVTQARGICEGMLRDGTVQLSHVNHLDTIQKGDYIISSGEGTIFPRGFGIARVVDFKKQGLFYEVSARPLLTLDTIEYCYLFEKGTEYESARGSY